MKDVVIKEAVTVLVVYIITIASSNYHHLQSIDGKCHDDANLNCISSESSIVIGGEEIGNLEVEEYDDNQRIENHRNLEDEYERDNVHAGDKNNNIPMLLPFP